MSKSVTVGPYQNGKARYELRVSEADGEIGMYKSLLQDTATREENLKSDALPEEQRIDLRLIGRRIHHTMIYPALIAASEPVNGFDEWPIPFDECIKLPEPFLIEWEDKVFTANPHWKPKPPETKADVDELEKKVPRSSPKS